MSTGPLHTGPSGDGPRDQDSGGDRAVPGPAEEPTTGPPAGAGSAAALDASSPPGARRDATLRSDQGEGSGPAAGSDPGATPGSGRTPRPGATPGGNATPRSGATPRPGAAPGSTAEPRSGAAPGQGGTPGPSATPLPGATPGGSAKPGDGGPGIDGRKRRKRRLIVAGVAVGAAIIVIALCAGALAVVQAFRNDAADPREGRRLQDGACLELENRLNRLIPPGATVSPQARAVAVRDENAATRIYVSRLTEQRVSDGWRELLDARTSFAEALDAQAKSRTTAFFVAPAPRDGVSLADQLARWSPATCAGPIRRLATPDL